MERRLAACAAALWALLVVASGDDERLIGWRGETHSVGGGGGGGGGPAEEAVPQVPTRELPGGGQMPVVGFGTAGLGDRTAQAVESALRNGYRLIDSAMAPEWYREDLVGEALARSGVPREELFITTKLHPRHHGYRSTQRQVENALKVLRVTYLDLVLLHYPECWGSLCAGSPRPEGAWQSSYQALELLHSRGTVRAIGVSNFNLEQLWELVNIARVPPAVLQTYSDPFHQDHEAQVFAAAQGIAFQAYSSLGTQHLARTRGRNPVLSHPTIRAIADRHGVSAAQVVLRFALDCGQLVVPRSADPGRQRQNLDLFGFSLTAEDKEAITRLDRTDPLEALRAADEAM